MKFTTANDRVSRLNWFGATAAGIGALGALLALPSPAEAVPSFAAQTGQPCAACHVGSFGPQLTGFGRDFKLYGSVSSDRPSVVRAQ